MQADEAIAQYEGDRAVGRRKHMRALVLFSGSGSVEQHLFQTFPHIEVTALDTDPKSSATYKRDVKAFSKTELSAYRPGYFDIIWASPPCTEYSRAKTKGTAT